MLLSFSVSNWKSIRDELRLSMIATKERQHGDRLVNVAKFHFRVLPTSLLFGANASGKSCFVTALAFMRDLICHRTSLMSRQPYLLNEKSRLSPSTFAVELLLNDLVYIYKFVCDRKRIYEEQLIEVNSTSEHVLFHRHEDGKIDLDPRFTESTRQRLSVIAEGTRAEILFLSNTIDQMMTTFQPVFNWFKDSLQIILPSTKIEPLTWFVMDEMLSLYNCCLPLLDTGIKRIETIKVTLESLNLSIDERDQLESLISEKGEVIVAHHREDGIVFIERSDDGSILVKKIMTVHETADGEEVQFALKDESEGSRRLLDLLPAFCRLPGDRMPMTVVIDEVDRSMHSLLTAALFQLFFDDAGRGLANQVIVTTHDLQLMTQDLFRRDEMWFFERTNQGTALIPFSDFQDIRYDKVLRKSYLEGRMGGIPKLNPEIIKLCRGD